MSQNSWPDGRRRAMDQDEHERWNAGRWPGTRQLCSECEDATGRCEEDSIYRGERGPLCEGCGEKYDDDGNEVG
jgi:hypothetical protein